MRTNMFVAGVLGAMVAWGGLPGNGSALASEISKISNAAKKSGGITAHEWMTIKINNFVRRTSSVDDLADEMTFFFRQNDVDGGGFSKSDIALVQKIRSARNRARMIERWSRKDINGDGQVSIGELTKYYYPKVSRPVISNGVKILPNMAQMEKALAKILKKELVFDLNKDGRIDFREVMQGARAKDIAYTKKRYRYRTRYAAKIPKSLDANQDKTISVSEFKAVVRDVLDKIDIDGDGEVSNNEKKLLKKQVAIIRKKQRSSRFKMFKGYRSNHYRKKYDHKL